jgi:spore germination protein YaaH
MLRPIALMAICSILAACHRIPSTAPPSTALFYLPEPALADAGLVIIDSTSLRPSLNASGAPTFLVTNYDNGHYHAATIRAISEDSAVTANAARQVVLQSGETGPLVLDFQDVAPEQLKSFTNLLRNITAFARGRGRAPVALVVPPQDTLSYPSEILGRVVDVLIVRAFGDHRPGTAPGAPATAEFITRALGPRTKVLGPSRVIAALPLFGYRWERDGTAKAVSYADVSASLNAEASAFRRDPATSFLVATGRDGWTAWVPDGRTIAYLISVVQRRGVSGVALTGLRGAAPDIAQYAAQALRR